MAPRLYILAMDLPTVLYILLIVATEHWVRVREGGCDINEETLMMQPLATD